MPTYNYSCQHCGHEDEIFQSIGEYCRQPVRLACPEHGPMERKLTVNAFSGLANALAGDRHYDGLQASDGADISTRTKHREYMKQKDLCMASDYKQTWKDAAKAREAIRTGVDPTRKSDVREIVERASQN